MLKDDTLENHTIVITGGGTGLGKSMGSYFLELGANLVITSRKQEVLDATANELAGKGPGEVLPIAADVRNYDQIQKVISQVLNRFGSIQGLVNNAAGNFISPTERLSSGAFDAVIDIVLKGTTNWTLALGKHWIEAQTGGTMLNIITTYAWTGSGYVVPSACAKAGVLALTRSLAVEWAKYGIRTNAIAPGPFPTEGAWSRLLPGDMAKMFDPATKIPLKRVGQHKELADLAAYLMSHYSGYVNGEVITIDGGEWLKGAGEFNHLDQITPEMWNELTKIRKDQG